jgi:hypothetical protein
MVTIYGNAQGEVVHVDFSMIAGPREPVPPEAVIPLTFDEATNDDLLGLVTRRSAWPRLRIGAGQLTWNGVPVVIHPPTQAGAESERIAVARKLLHSGAVPDLDPQQILDAVHHLIVLVRDHDRRFGLDVPVVVIGAKEQARPVPPLVTPTGTTPAVTPDTPISPRRHRAPRTKR